MKKQIIFIILLFSCYNLFADGKPKVASTASIIWDMAKIIGGEHIEATTIVPIGGDPHIYEPKPGDVRLISKSDLVLKNGLTFEGWIDKLIDNSGTKAKVVTVTEGVPAIANEIHKNSTDPHAWMDVTLGLIYIKNIKDALVELVPAHKADFEKNYLAYKKELEELDAYIMAKMKTIPEERRILITSHDAFQYYGRRYNIRLEAILGISTDAEEQTSDIMRLNKVIKASKVPAVFVESTINPMLLEQIAKDNDIVVGGELFADSIGDEDSEAPSYVAMLRHNTDVIVAALSKTQEENKANPIEKESSSNNMLFMGLAALLFIGGFFLMVKKLNG